MKKGSGKGQKRLWRDGRINQWMEGSRCGFSRVCSKWDIKRDGFRADDEDEEVSSRPGCLHDDRSLTPSAGKVCKNETWAVLWGRRTRSPRGFPLSSFPSSHFANIVIYIFQRSSFYPLGFSLGHLEREYYFALGWPRCNSYGMRTWVASPKCTAQKAKRLNEKIKMFQHKKEYPFLFLKKNNRLIKNQDNPLCEPEKSLNSIGASSRSGTLWDQAFDQIHFRICRRSEEQSWSFSSLPRPCQTQWTLDLVFYVMSVDRFN